MIAPPAVRARELPALDATAPLGLAWQELVAACPESGFMQSLGWAAFKRAQGLAVRHLGLFDEAERLMGGALLYGPAEHGPGLWISPDGPVLPWHDEATARAGLQALSAAVEGLAAESGAIAWRVEPRLLPPKPSLLRDFRRSPVDLMPVDTLDLDLDRSESEILGAMHPKGRYNIRLAARHGVSVSVSSDPADAMRFHDVIVEAGEREDFFVEGAPFFVTLAATLCPLGMARFLFVEHGGETLGAMLLVTHGHRATYLYGGATRLKRPLMGGYALQWEAIRLARGLGCTTYDFYGYEPFGDPNHPYAKFSRFKRQFGGTPRRFIGAHERPFLDRLADAVIQAVNEIGW